MNENQIDKNYLENNISTKYIGRKIYTFKNIDSTNLEAKRNINNQIPHGSVFITASQSNGKGRNNNLWFNYPNQQILMSIVLEKRHLKSSNFLTLLVGLSICKYLRNLTNKLFYIKWPNDIIINNKKICGILTEAVTVNNTTHFIVGIGINIFQNKFDYEISKKATSLVLEKFDHYNINNIICEILFYVEKEIENFFNNNPQDFILHYKQLCINIGQHVKTKYKGILTDGVCVNLNNKGELVVALISGEILEINSGNVIVQDIY